MKPSFSPGSPGKSPFGEPPGGPRSGPLEVHPLTPMIYWVEGGIGNCGFIVGGTGVIVIDATISPGSGRDLLKKIAGITPKPVKAVILTHGDIDHIGGLAAFPVGMQIIAHEKTAAKMEAGVAGGNRMVSPNHLPNCIIKEDKTAFRIEDVDLEILHWAPAHTAGDLVIHLPDSRIVFTGDIFTMDQPVALIHREQGGTSAGWVTTAKAVVDLPADRFVVGHGTVQNRESLCGRIDRAESEIKAIRDLVKKGLSLGQVQMKVSDPPPGTETPGPGGPRFMPFSEVVYRELTETV